MDGGGALYLRDHGNRFVVHYPHLCAVTQPAGGSAVSPLGSRSGGWSVVDFGFLGGRWLLRGRPLPPGSSPDSDGRGLPEASSMRSIAARRSSSTARRRRP